MDVKHTLTNQDISNVDIENGQLTFDINGNIYIDYNGTRHQISTMNTSTTSEDGLMSSTDKAKLDNIEDGATAVSPSTTTPKVAGTATVGTETGYSRGDHVHPLQTTVSGNAGTATKLATSRTIGLSGAVTGTATSFDGSADITIPTTSINATYLTGTASIDTTGNASTSDSATVAEKVGTDTIGSTSKPVYIATGTPTEVTSIDSTLLSGTASVSTTGNAGTATKLATARTITLSGDVTGSTTFDGSSDKTITTTLGDLDASKITTGTLDISRLPSAALERCVVVTDDTARFALTTDDVQLGDTVKVTSTAIMYMVTDTDNLDNENGYTEYAAGTASVALSCSGNSATATQLTTARTINGTSFDGTANITTAQWGTTRNISIADSTGTNIGTAVGVNGSSEVTLKLPSTIEADIIGNADTSTTTTNIIANASTTTKAYVLGATASGTTPLYDIGVYLDTTSGELHASTFNGYVLGVASEKDIDTEISDTTSTNLPTTEAVVTYVDNALASINSVSTQDTSLTCTLPDDL